MFRRSLRALGGSRPKSPTLGGRNILVPPKPAYPLQGQALTPLGRPIRSRSTAAERRRRSITYLAVFIIVTFALGFGVRPLSFLLVINLVADILLVAYLALAMYITVWPPQGERKERQEAVAVPVDPQLQPQRVAEGL